MICSVAIIDMYSYIYYRIYNFYKKWGDSVPDVMAVGVITFVEACNFLTIVYALNYQHVFHFELSIELVLGVFAVYFINYYILSPTYQRTFERWKDEDSTIRDIKGFCIWLYIFMSGILLVIVL